MPASYIKSGLLLFLLLSALCGRAFNIELHIGWRCKKASEVSEPGEKISMASYSVKNWMPATVPGTVLTTLLDNKKIPDPFYGMNNERIPDISKVGAAYYTYWFVEDFRETVRFYDQMYIIFYGINYSADVYINGHKVNAEPVQGMFHRHRFNITRYIAKNGNNRLAVIVRPPIPAGIPNGGQGGDGTIAHSVTNQYPAGWDWIQPIRDRNTGIWDKVVLEKMGLVTVRDVQVITKVPGKRSSYGVQQPAYVSVSADLKNEADSAIEGTLQCTINKKEYILPVTLGAGEQRKVTVPVITVDNPRLWWPNGYGKPELYDAQLRFVVGYMATIEEHTTFGIRELYAPWNEHTNSRELYCNGQRIFIKGGNRILSDAMLRFSKERYDAEVRYHRDMNLNLIRVWGGGITERPDFYDACDKYGLLVMQDFWVSGDCNGRWYDPLKADDTITRRNYPDDHKLFLTACADQIKLLRSHPSLAFWCGGNEIRPPVDILRPLRDSLLPLLDGTRFFFEYSNDDSMSLNAHDGPYTIQRDNYFWEHRSWGFNSEIGSVGIGDTESLARFIPPANRVVPWYDAVQKKWMADSVWRYHKYYSYDSSVERYGHPRDIADFVLKAQLVNYNQYRSLLESFAARMWDWYTGVIIWKTQNPWTAIVGQMYDVYLAPNACLYGLAEGAKPTHVIFNPLSQSPIIVNTNPSVDSFTLAIKSIDAKGVQRTICRSHLPPGVVKADAPYALPSLADTLAKPEYSQGYFLACVLSYSDHGAGYKDENFYWYPGLDSNYAMLQNMPRASLHVTATRISDDSIMVVVTNPKNSKLAFFNHIDLVDSATNKPVLPVFCSNNYFSLLPGAVQRIFIVYNYRFDIFPKVRIDGWNTDRQYITINKKRN